MGHNTVKTCYSKNLLAQTPLNTNHLFAQTKMLVPNLFLFILTYQTTLSNYLLARILCMVPTHIFLLKIVKLSRMPLDYWI